MIYFGEFVRKLRIKNLLTLREFCLIANIDASDWSKIERGIARPPKSRAVLEEIAKILKITRDSDEYNTLFDLAAIGHIPVGLIDNQTVLNMLPVFFRTVRGDKPSKEELKELVRLLRES